MISDETRKLFHDTLDGMLDKAIEDDGRRHKLICKTGYGATEVPVGSGMNVTKKLNGVQFQVIALVPIKQQEMFNTITDAFMKDLDT